MQAINLQRFIKTVIQGIIVEVQVSRYNPFIYKMLLMNQEGIFQQVVNYVQPF